MCFRGVTIAWVAFMSVLFLGAIPLRGQYQPSERLEITGTRAATWTSGGEDVVQVEGPVTIDLDRAKLSAQRAVIWITPDPDIQGQQRTEVVLLGDAKVEQAEATRSGPRLYVTAAIRGPIRITANERESVDRSGSPLFRTAAAVREQGQGPRVPAQPAPAPPDPADRDPAAPDAAPALPPAPAPARNLSGQAVPPPAAPAPRKVDPILFQADEVETIETDDGKVALVLSRGVTLIQRRTNEQGAEELLELQADKAVLYTPLESVRDLQNAGQMKQVQDAVTGAYLEGDVRVVYTPATGGLGEQRLRARRVFYDFTTDRAILTNAVLHTIEPNMQVPVVVRANRIRQLSLGEYAARDVELSISQFALPSYSIAADRIYVRARDTGDPRLGQRVTFGADNAFFKTFGVPLFYFPKAGGSITTKGFPLRGAGVENSSRYGVGVRTTWGLFETLGQPPPKDLDAFFHLDYFSDRGPAGGLGGEYSGGFLTDPARERWSFEGEFDSYFVYDEGFDSFGRLPTRLDEEQDLRGHALWEHQHFFPDNWQAQVRAGWVSDPTFLEEWFERDFERGPPHDLMAYLKRQEQTEAFTLLVQFQPNDLVTTAEMVQEQFEVERLPEIGYHRVGDSLLNDQLTFFSNNRVSLLRFNETGATLREQGFEPAAGVTPGIPSLGTTGTNDDLTFRGDFRQEVNYPFSLGQFRVVPYGMGRYTGYDDSPEAGSQNRLFGGVGARINTSFYSIDNSINSRLFDLHRVRHVIEPELNLFTSGTTVDRNEVFIYDEEVDAINDISAVQIALRQRWQTKRGGPGRWRSVDFFSLGIEANFFSNEPPDEEMNPLGFRGLYFPSMPEASVPRDSVNGDVLWRLSDNTAVIGDVQYNLQENTLATAAVGLMVQRDVGLLYFVGTRYIEELGSNITTLFISYDLSPKYSIVGVQNYDFGLGQNVSSVVEIRRRFDQFIVIARGFYNDRDNQSGFSINLSPTAFGMGIDSTQFQSAFDEN